MNVKVVRAGSGRHRAEGAGGFGRPRGASRRSLYRIEEIRLPMPMRFRSLTDWLRVTQRPR